VTAQSQVQTLENHTDRMTGALRTLQVHIPGTQHFELSARPSSNEVGGYLSALCFLQGALEAMAEEVTLLRARDEASRQTITAFREQMRSAAAIQRDLLPSNLPMVAGLDVFALFRPAEALSGDLYDVFRIDETHVGFALADATGHGLPGGVLATFASRSLCGASMKNGPARSLSPADQLSRINKDLFGVGFRDCPFVTALYAVYHEPTRMLTWARGGAPYPVFVRRREAPRRILSQGPLIGALADAAFETVSLTLEPGDTVVFHTDGLEALVGDRRSQRGLNDLSNSEWFHRLGGRPLDGQMEDLETRLDSIDEADWPVDDVTVVALHVRG